MAEDWEIAGQVADLQARGKDYSMFAIPGYIPWAEKKLAEGESAAFIGHLDSMSMFLLPEELAEIKEDVFEELLEDLKQTLA